MKRQATLQHLRGAIPLIAPSLLKCNFGNLQQEIDRLHEAGAQVLHLDVMDGQFVPNLTYGPVVIEGLRKLTDLPLDAHLMVAQPERLLDGFVDAGCNSVTIHYEATLEPEKLLQRIREADVASGLAVNPKTPVEDVEPLLPYCDVLLVMSVEPGFGGQKFMPQALDKLAWLSQRMPSGSLLAIDGGITKANIGTCAGAGAQMFVVGSAIFESGNYGSTIGELRSNAANHMAAPSSLEH